MAEAVVHVWAPPSPARPHAIVEFRAMASRCRIIADTEALAHRGAELVTALERRWSRFRDDSEVSAVNRAGGAPCRVSADTVTLFERAEQARAAVAGFNPFVLDRLEALGYPPEQGMTAAPGSHPVPDGAIEILAAASIVRLPGGLRFDPGGIGKGLAGDLVAERLLAAGSLGVQVELGGDVRVGGTNWVDGPWRVAVADPLERSDRIGQLTIDSGGAATSSTARTVWTHAGVARHHLIDPATGLPSESDVVSVSATSSQLWWAEVVAKAALLAGSHDAEATMRAHGCAGLVTVRGGRVITVEHGVCGAAS